MFAGTSRARRQKGLSVPGSEQAIKSSHTALKVSDQATLITGANMESPDEGTAPILMMFEQICSRPVMGRS